MEESVKLEGLTGTQKRNYVREQLRKFIEKECGDFISKSLANLIVELGVGRLQMGAADADTKG